MSGLQFGRATDRLQLEHFLKREPGLHLYSIGDLDDYYWPQTTWFAAWRGDEIVAVALYWDGHGDPVVLALADSENGAMDPLIRHVSPQLPESGQVHYTDSAIRALQQSFVLADDSANTDHVKMVLQKVPESVAPTVGELVQLVPGDEVELRELYTEAFGAAGTESFFIPSDLTQGPFFGVRVEGRLVSAAGVHVLSKQMGVAGIGNVATAPEYWGKGLAKAVTSRLCRELSPTADLIGMNVKKDNLPAIAAYEKIGFETVVTFRETRYRRR